MQQNGNKKGGGGPLINKQKEENLRVDNLSAEWRPRYRRPHCCSSLSPISDCFFKAPVAEDINYPASVNHVIYRPRLPSARRDENWGGEREREREEGRRAEERGEGEREGALHEVATAGNWAKRSSTACLPACSLARLLSLPGHTNILLSPRKFIGRPLQNFTRQIAFSPSFRTAWTSFQGNGR